MPPQPSDLASAAPHRLRARSSRSETIAVYFSRIHSTTCASGIAENIAENAAASQDQVRYSVVERALSALALAITVVGERGALAEWVDVGHVVAVGVVKVGCALAEGVLRCGNLALRVVGERCALAERIDDGAAVA